MHRALASCVRPTFIYFKNIILNLWNIMYKKYKFAQTTA